MEEESSKFKEILSWIIYIVAIVAITFFIITFVGQRTKVSGRSMENTLHDGDNLIVEKVSYRFREPKRFEIVVFPYRYEEDVFYIKRIIGLPGETVQIQDGDIYIDGEILEEDFGKEIIIEPGIAYQPVTLGEDEYFVMGDNRNNSADSRVEDVGPIHKDEFVGRAWVRIWPLNKIGVIDHGE